MSSEESSEQSCVHEGAGYDEVYPLSQDDREPLMMEGFHLPTHLPQRRMRTQTWTNQRVTQTTKMM